MTAYDNDLPLIIQQFTDREVDWLYSRVNWQVRIEVATTDARREIIGEYIQLNKNNLNEVLDLQKASKYHLLENTEIDWIEQNNYRLLRWIAGRKSPINPYQLEEIPGITNKTLSAEQLYTHFIRTLDNWGDSIEHKKSTLNNIKIVWSDLLRRDTKLTWLKQNDDSQIEWAWEYVKEKEKPGISLRAAITVQEKYLGILEVFDCWPLHEAELQIFQDTMKRAWAQQKYRASLKHEKKKQSTYVLSTEAKSQLKVLAKKNNVNLNQMLEYIIDQAFKSHKK